MRLTKKQLENIKKQYSVDRLFSWSMINTFMTSYYEYYLKYVLHTPEDRQDCIYTTTGTISHDILEKLYNNQIKYNQMNDYFEDGWVTATAISNLKFDRNDEIHNEKIEKTYYEDLKHFFDNHTVIPYKVLTEKFITTQIENFVLQGYIDAVFVDDEGCYNIIDFKTSSIYKGKNLESKSGQLCVYCMGLMQKGIPLEKIKIGFNFLKYVKVEYEQANGIIKTRDIERCKIGESLSTNAKMWLKKLGYTNEVDDYLKLLIDSNNVNALPKDVRAKYKIEDCYVYVPLSEELLNKWTDIIATNIKDILLREKDYAETKNDKIFWDDEDSVKKESYYFSTLCAYSPNLHLPYKAYLEKLESVEKGVDLFSDVGSKAQNQIVDINNNKKNDVNDIDLSWLDSI